MGNQSSPLEDFQRRRLAAAGQTVQTQGGYCPVRGLDAHDKQTDSRLGDRSAVENKKGREVNGRGGGARVEKTMIIGAKEGEVSGVNFGNSGDGGRKKKRIIDREANNNPEDPTENTERETRSREEEQEC